MNKIEFVELNKIAKTIMGQSPKGDFYNKDGVGLPLLNGPTEFGQSHPNCTLFTTDSKRKSKRGDLIFCVRGSTTGRMNWSDQVYSLGRGVCAIRGQTALETRFIKYSIDNYLDQLLKLAGGGTFPNLTKETINNFKIPYPHSRIKIAAILSAYDDLIENNTRRIQILEEMAQRIYREWFVHFRFPGHENVKMVESELGMIPEGWEIQTLGQVAFILMGQSPKSVYYNELQKGLPFHQGVKDFGEFFPNDRIYCTLEKRIAEKGDILFSVRAPVGRINIAIKKMVIGRGLSAIRSKNGNQVFLYYQLKHIFKLKDQIGGGTIFKAVTKDDMHNINVLKPLLNIENKFQKMIVSNIDQIEILSKKNRILGQTRDLLLPKLISGKIDVEDLDIIVDKTSEEI